MIYEGNAPAIHEIHRPARKVQLIEVMVFLFLIVPSMVTSLFLLDHAHLRFMTVAISSIMSDLALVSLVLYFIWRNGEPLGQIGWTVNNVWQDLGWGLLLFLPVVYGANLLESILHKAGLSAPTKLPSFLVATGSAKVFLACVMVIVVAVVEETIFRGYLILRFKAVTGRTGAAVLLSSAIFALGHGYEGLAGMISIFFLGVTLAVVYLWRKSLVAAIVMHFLIDFSSIVLTASGQAK
jgi:membrane protease YdiL (CAAX protease family)